MFQIVAKKRVITNVSWQARTLPKWGRWPSAILKYSLEGHFIHNYPVEDKTIYVTVTNLGHIVYSNIETNSTTSIDEEGQIQWEYKHPKLMIPCNVDKEWVKR